jgi:hypothetical protein
MTRKVSRIGLVLLVLSLAVGCATFKSLTSGELSPVDKAIKVGDDLMDYYTLVHKNAEDAYNSSTKEQKAKLREKVNPKLNAAKNKITLYNDFVLAWKKGELPPNLDPEADLYTNQQEISKALTEALQLINQLMK